MQKKPQTKENTLRIFIELCGSKVQLAPPHGNFINGFGNSEIVYMLLLFQMLLLTDIFLFKKSAYFEPKFMKYLIEPTWVWSNQLKDFWKMDALSSYSPVPNNSRSLSKGWEGGGVRQGGRVGGCPTDDLNINKAGVQMKGGVWKMFSVKSGKLLLHWTKLERQIKVILLSHSQGIFKYMYLKPPWPSYN